MWRVYLGIVGLSEIEGGWMAWGVMAVYYYYFPFVTELF